MKIFEILTESQVGKQALDYKRSNRYPDGTDIPESLPPRYQPASFPGVPKNQRCDNCGYYDTKTKKCDKFKGEPVVKPAYWCLKWEPMEEEVTEGVAGPKSCWPGYRKTGTQPGTGKNKGKRVNDCEKIKEDGVEEEWSQKYKSSINCSNPKGFSQKAHCAGKKKNESTVNELSKNTLSNYSDKADTDIVKKHRVRGPQAAAGDKTAVAKTDKTIDKRMAGIDKAAKRLNNESVDELARVLTLSGLELTPDEQFDIIEEMVESIALEHGVNSEQIWEDFESVDDAELYESAAWRRKEGKSKSGGLNAKGVASYRRENPGSKLQTAVTTKPSKLKKGSKAAKRRKSFCARMSGVDGPMKKNGKPTRKALALRKWNC